MGHNLDVHKHYYRLPQEALLLAKVSKLLMLVEKGKVSEFSGKPLDEIDVADDDAEVDEVSESEMDTADETTETESTTDSQTDASEPESVEVRGCQNVKKKKVRHKSSTKAAMCQLTKRDYKYCKWTKKQNEFLFQQPEIQRLLREKTPPGKSLCLLIIERSNGILHDKDVNAVKNKVYNTYRLEKMKH